MTPAIKMLIVANVAVFLVTWVSRVALEYTGLVPVAVFQGWELWRPVTYMFAHSGPFHLLFNMLSLWMFGVELERRWGTTYFTKYYFACGVGAGATTLVLSLIPGFPGNLYTSFTVGASGAIYGILLAYALYFPHRQLAFMMLFPIAVKYYVMIIGAIALLMSTGGGDGVAHTTHLGGLIVGYLFLKGGRLHLLSEIQYRYLKWRINRSRRRFDVYHGGRAHDANRRVH